MFRSLRTKALISIVGSVCILSGLLSACSIPSPQSTDHNPTLTSDFSWISILPNTSQIGSSTTTQVPILKPNVKITRIFYDGLAYRTEADEYVEITNLGSQAVDLKGWILKDISEGYPSLTFPSYTLQPGQKIRVYTNQVHSEYGGFSFRSGKAVWNNTIPDTAALFDAQGKEVSRLSY